MSWTSPVSEEASISASPTRSFQSWVTLGLTAPSPQGPACALLAVCSSLELETQSGGTGKMAQ